ncbi:MAG: TRAP transporter large permease subunit [Proteobacteria bacterium]|nr:TRAP transporter large permease subunit [Pseudomonadota bacterium]
MESVIIFFVVFLILLVLGVPVATSLGFTSVLLIWKYNLGIQVLAPNFYANVAKFQLLALPFFILAGLILDRCGISKRLIRLVSLLVGPIPGGSCHCNYNCGGDICGDFRVRSGRYCCPRCYFISCHGCDDL